MKAWHFRFLPKNTTIAHLWQLDKCYQTVLVTLLVFRKLSHSHAVCKNLKPKLQHFRPDWSICMLSVSLHLLVSPEACDRHLCTAVGGFLNPKSITKTSQYCLSSCCKRASVVFFGSRSFTRPSTALAAIGGLGTRLWLYMVTYLNCTELLMLAQTIVLFFHRKEAVYS